MARVIRREPAAAANEQHPLIIVGGGIYGAMLALEAARRGLRPLLLERDDFGGATSWNSLRIVHGGLRYLQTLNLRRFRESVGERRRFLATFPELVRPLPCLMPLYGGLRRPAILRAALAVNDLLARRRNAGVAETHQLPGGRILSAVEARCRVPGLERKDLQGAALWHDAVLLSPQRVLMETLRWAAAAGGQSLNYVECTGFLKAGDRVRGVRATDRLSGEPLEFRSDSVINAAGPWCRQVAAAAGAGAEHLGLFRPSLAFNVLLDCAPPAEFAVAVTPPRPGARTYFLVPWWGRTMAGTFHAAWTGAVDNPAPDEALIASFLADLDAAIPSLEVRLDKVRRVSAGLLPLTARGGDTLAVREVIHDHGSTGGLRGVLSVSGVKYTTARLVAERAMGWLPAARLPRADAGRPGPLQVPGPEALPDLLTRDAPALRAVIRTLVREEAPAHPEDLLLRRTDWGTDPELGRRILPLIAEAFPP